MNLSPSNSFHSFPNDSFLDFNFFKYHFNFHVTSSFLVGNLKMTLSHYGDLNAGCLDIVKSFVVYHPAF